MEDNKIIRKQILKLSLPASAEMVFQLMLGLIDTIFISSLGETALGGVSLTCRVTTLLLVIYGAIGVGGSILITQYYGKKDNPKVSSISGQLFTSSVVLGIISSFFMYIFAKEILSLMGAEAAVIEQGTAFFKIIALSMPITAANMMVVAVLRSVGNTKIPMFATLISVVINTILNYTLIFGVGFIPAMGIRGCAVATVISKGIGLALVIYYLFVVNDKVSFSKKNFKFSESKSFIKLIKLSVPVAISDSCWALGVLLYTVLLTSLGTKELVANHIIVSIEDILIMFAFGLTVSGITIIGQEIGARNIDMMHKKAKEILKIGLFISIIFVFVLLGMSNLVKFIYPDVSDNAITLAKWGMMFFAFFQPLKITNFILDNGVLKGGGDTRFTMLTNIAVVFLVGLPVAYLFGLVFKFGFWGVCIGKAAEEISRFLLMYTRYRRNKWYRLLAD